MSAYPDYIEALHEYLDERPWGYRTPFAEQLIERLEAGQSPEQAMDAVELEGWRIARAKERDRKWGLNSSVQSTLDELRELMRE